MAAITNYNFKDLKTSLMAKSAGASDPNGTVTGLNFQALSNLADALCAEREGTGNTCTGHTNLRATTVADRNFTKFAGISDSLVPLKCSCNSFSCSCNTKATCTCVSQSTCSSQSWSCSCESNWSCSCYYNCSCDSYGGGCSCENVCTCNSNCPDDGFCWVECICNSDYCSCNSQSGGGCSCQYNYSCSCDNYCTCNQVCSSNVLTCPTYQAACTPYQYACPCQRLFAF